MAIQMNVHQDRRDSGQVVWWADTQDIDRLTVGGDILESATTRVVHHHLAVDEHLDQLPKLGTGGRDGHRGRLWRGGSSRVGNKHRDDHHGAKQASGQASVRLARS